MRIGLIGPVPADVPLDALDRRLGTPWLVSPRPLATDAALVLHLYDGEGQALSTTVSSERS